MKIRNLFTSIVVLLFATGAGSAFAEWTCEDRYVEDIVIDDDVVIAGQNCRLQGVTVNGNVSVLNSEKFTIQNGNVNGNVTVVASGQVLLNDFNASGYKVVATGNEQVEVSLVEAATLKVVGNNVASVFYNAAGNFVCKKNIRLVAGKNEGPNAATQCDTLGL